MKISQEVRNTGKHNFHRLTCPSSSSCSEKVNLTNHSTYEPEMLQVNRFSSKLVHRHMIYSLTLLLLLICVLTIQYNADQIHVKTPMNILHVNR